jgi:hypothetical protein
LSHESSPCQCSDQDTPPSSLAELGLSLTVLTEHLTLSHFSASPTSGAIPGSTPSSPLPFPTAHCQRPYLPPCVSFISVVVMEHKGVLVTISGCRDGVHVYALGDFLYECAPPLQPLRHRSASSARQARGRSTYFNDRLRRTVTRREIEVVELDNN